MKKLWLWKNFVDGRPEYWAFDNPYPCEPGGGDPLTLGEPCGYAILKESTQGRFDVSEAEVIAAIKRSTARPEGVATGWKLVPVKPTMDMIRAANIGSQREGLPAMAIRYPDAVGPEDVYEAMVNAAPLPQEHSK